MNGNEKPCPFCGSTAYTWGEVQGEHLRFVDEDAGFFKWNFSVSSRVRARRCKGCGNVQIFDTLERPRGDNLKLSAFVNSRLGRSTVPAYE